MATRIYLPSSGSAPVTPSTWNFPNQINPLTFAGVTVPIASALTTRLQATGTTSPVFRAMLRYVIGPLAAQSISGTVHGIIKCLESATGANATLAIAVKIIQPDGSDRAVLLAYVASDSASSPYEMSTSLMTRRWFNVTEVEPITLTTQSATAGDYLVIELGFRSATTVTRNISLRYGDNAASDFADTDGLTTDLRPWIEFSQTLTWPSQNINETVTLAKFDGVTPTNNFLIYEIATLAKFIGIASSNNLLQLDAVSLSRSVGIDTLTQTNEKDGLIQTKFIEVEIMENWVVEETLYDP